MIVSFFQQRLIEPNDAEDNRDKSSKPLDKAFGDPLAQDYAENYADSIGDKHPGRRAEPYRNDGIELSSEGNSGKLCLVAHFRKNYEHH